MSLAYFMDIPPEKLKTKKDGTKYYYFREAGHYYFLNPDHSQLYAYGSWKLFINSTGYRRWIPQQREFAYEPDEMNSRFIFNVKCQIIYRETRECLRDIGAPSLGQLIERYHKGIVQSCLNYLEDRGLSAQERQYYHGIAIGMEEKLPYLKWKVGAGYQEWLQKGRRQLELKGSYSEYNVWLDMELERVARDMDPEMIKEEAIKKENAEQGIIKRENDKEVAIKQELTEEVFIKPEA